jgi:4-hydroxy-tetrahydrodipicolinate synthase
MSMMGLLEPVYRLPMVAPLPASRQKIQQVVESVGLLAAAGAH